MLGCQLFCSEFMSFSYIVPFYTWSTYDNKESETEQAVCFSIRVTFYTVAYQTVHCIY